VLTYLNVRCAPVLEKLHFRHAVSRFLTFNLCFTIFVRRACARNRFMISRFAAAQDALRQPWRTGLRAHFSLPASVRGPVDFVQGLVFLMVSACLSRDSVVQRGIF
jgi:hypothetical protein